jgi:hypothetical protein
MGGIRGLGGGYLIHTLQNINLGIIMASIT